MTNMRALVLGIPAGLLVLCLALIFIDFVGTEPHYELQRATIVMVGPDARGIGGFVGEQERTLIKFRDGYTMYLGGRRGVPGEPIRAYRQTGIDSPFGVFATRY